MASAHLSAASINRHLATLRSVTKLGRMLGMMSWYLEVPGVKAERRRDVRGSSVDDVKRLLAATSGDSEAETRDLLKIMLASHGAVVTVCASGDQALTEIEQWKPQIVVSDIGMPAMDGYSLIRKVRGLESELHEVPAIALTAYARAEDRMRALAAGFQMHVPKPVEASELVMVIASLVKRI